MRLDAGKVAGTLLFGSYFGSCALQPGAWHFIDGANLVIHEAGHFLLSFDGFMLAIAGGTIMQLLVPAGAGVYFLWTQQRWAATVMLMWLGQSLLNVAVYAADARDMVLPLVGPEDALHDWNYMLASTGLLQQTALIAGTIRVVGMLVILAGLLLAALLCRVPPAEAAGSGREAEVL